MFLYNFGLKIINYQEMAILNATQDSPKEDSADQTQGDVANIIIGIVLLACALVGCSLAVVALGRDFFIGKNPPVVFVGALVWVDFIGVFSTSVLVFHGFVKGAEWMRESPQCGLQVCNDNVLRSRPCSESFSLRVPFSFIHTNDGFLNSGSCY